MYQLLLINSVFNVHTFAIINTELFNIFKLNV